MTEVAAEVMVFLMALNPIARMVISSLFSSESYYLILKIFFIYFLNSSFLNIQTDGRTSALIERLRVIDNENFYA